MKAKLLMLAICVCFLANFTNQQNIPTVLMPLYNLIARIKIANFMNQLIVNQIRVRIIVKYEFLLIS